MIDVALTLLDLADVSIPDRMQGRSLRSLPTDTDAIDFFRYAVRWECNSALGTDSREEFSCSNGTMIRDDRCKLVVYHGHDIAEFFELSNEPDE